MEYCERLGPVSICISRISNIENPIAESYSIIHCGIPYTDKTESSFNAVTLISSCTQSRRLLKVYSSQILIEDLNSSQCQDISNKNLT